VHRELKWNEEKRRLHEYIKHLEDALRVRGITLTMPKPWVINLSFVD
jgi:hypothetical protein